MNGTTIGGAWLDELFECARCGEVSMGRALVVAGRAMCERCTTRAYADMWEATPRDVIDLEGALDRLEP